MLYTNTPPHMRFLWAGSVDMTHALLIPGAEYSTSNEERLRFELVISCYFGSNIMSRN